MKKIRKQENTNEIINNSRLVKNKLIIPLLLLSLALIFSFTVGTVSAEKSNVTDYTAEINNTTVPFVENEGQTSSEVEYYADTFYGTVYVTNDSITHSIRGENNTTMVIKEQFLDKNGNVITFKPTGQERGTAKVDYYVGNNQSKWKTALNTWNTISLGEIYHGIEVILRANGANIEKIFLIQPGANPDDIKMQILGTDNLQINTDGDLSLKTSIGDVLFSKPVAFQENKDIHVNYSLNGNIYSFKVGKYDTNKKLTIDPTLQYSTYLGGTRDDAGYSITTDNDGNIYITGYTDSINFPATTGAYQTNRRGLYDVFITKLTPNNHGTYDLQYSTYIGGTNYDYGSSITVDNNGNIYVTGYTWSSDFPTTIGAYQTTYTGNGEVFITKLTPNSQGTNDLKYSTYLGGTRDEYGYGITVDTTGNIYITGCTFSDDFPTTNGAYQTIKTGYGGVGEVFITKLTPNSQGANDLKYSTYLGGTDNDYGYGIVVDNDGNIYVTGYTWSNNFPTTTSAYQTTKEGYTGDAFITKLTPGSQGVNDLKYSTYLGGSEDDGGQGIAIDNAGNIYITGFTWSDDFPTTSGAYQTNHHELYDAFITKLTPDNQGTADLKYSTYLGGNGYDYGWSINLDSAGDIYITGYTDSNDFPTTIGAYQTTYAGNGDAFITKLTPDNQGTDDLKYGTYLGGAQYDFGYGVTVDGAGNSYIVGYTYSDNFPTTAGAYQTDYQGSGDAFVVKLGAVADLSIEKSVSNIKPRVNDTVTYTIIVQNRGPDTSCGVTVTDILPVGMIYVSSTANYGFYNPATGIWTIDYLPNGAIAVLTINSTVERAGTINNTAMVSALTYDPIINDNTATATLTATTTPNNNPSNDTPSNNTPNNNIPSDNTPSNSTSSSNNAHAATVAMQNTGIPVHYLLMAILLVLGGFLVPKRK